MPAIEGTESGTRWLTSLRGVKIVRAATSLRKSYSCLSSRSSLPDLMHSCADEHCAAHNIKLQHLGSSEELPCRCLTSRTFLFKNAIKKASLSTAQAVIHRGFELPTGPQTPCKYVRACARDCCVCVIVTGSLRPHFLYQGVRIEQLRPFSQPRRLSMTAYLTNLDDKLMKRNRHCRRYNEFHTRARVEFQVWN